ncbi:MFS transporter [Burkholderia cepacia]|uniref:MFS transporter n=1 Tax=Burkholderia cepacia TaxID=292 RepID=UPI00249F8A19|nr:MFS transporter [Burkholderia cepacia]WGY70184.1 MFS transporter [Burkholderia cepacia]
MKPSHPIETDALARLDNLPWTRFHTLMLVALGVGWALDSFETNIIGSVFGVLKSHWHLSAAQGSLAVSIWVFGMLVGAIAFGYLADRYGRKRLFLATLLWYAFFSVATVLSWNYASFLFFRAMTALAVGGEYSAVTATMGEFIPKRHRGRTDALILSGFPVGALLSAAVSYLVLNQLPAEWAWRVGFGLGTTMALVFFWIRRVIPESPRWLIQQGRVAEADAIVEQIVASAARDSHAPADRAQLTKRYVPTRFAHQAPAFWRNVGELFGAYRARCALAGALNFSQAAVVYGVLSLMALVILPYMKVPSTDMPLYYMIGNAAALAGGIVAAVLVEAWGRRASLFVSYTFTVAAIVFIYAMHALPGMVLGYCLIQFGVTWAYISGYVVSSEILPTRIRATGLGVSVAIGRLGAVIAPLMLTNVYAMSGSPSAALVVLLVLALPGPLAAGLWWLNGRETRRMSLEECSTEVGEQPAVDAAPRIA